MKCLSIYSFGVCVVVFDLFVLSGSSRGGCSLVD